MIVNHAAEAVKVKVGVISQGNRSFAVGLCLVGNNYGSICKSKFNLNRKTAGEAFLTVGGIVGEGDAVLAKLVNIPYLVAVAVTAVKAVAIVVGGHHINCAVHSKLRSAYTVGNSAHRCALIRATVVNIYL